MESAQNEFALQLLRQSAATDQNAFLSPLSISLALAMTYTGAGGKTAEEMRQILAPGMSDEDLHKAYSTIQSLISTPNDDHKLHTANRVYVYDQMHLKSGAQDKLNKFYKAELQQVNFGANGPAIAADINKWVEAQTANRIKDLISPDVLDALTRLVLVNAIYFKGDWRHKFDETRTHPEAFYFGDNKEKDVQMMHQKEHFLYNENDDCQVLGLPYKSADLCLFVFLPKERNGLAALEKGLTGEKMHKLMHDARRQEVVVAMPKMKLEQSFSLNDALKKIGMGTMFTPNADFSNFGNEPLYVSNVIHKAFLEVDERGSEAAAATAVVMMRCCAMINEKPPLQFIANHPYVFTLAHKHLPLFVGRFTQP